MPTSIAFKFTRAAVLRAGEDVERVVADVTTRRVTTAHGSANWMPTFHWTSFGIAESYWLTTMFGTGPNANWVFARSARRPHCCVRPVAVGGLATVPNAVLPSGRSK